MLGGVTQIFFATVSVFTMLLGVGGITKLLYVWNIPRKLLLNSLFILTRLYNLWTNLSLRFPHIDKLKATLKKNSRVYGAQFAYTVSCDSLIVNSLHYFQHQDLVSASFYLCSHRNSIGEGRKAWLLFLLCSFSATFSVTLVPMCHTCDTNRGGLALRSQ